MKMVRIIHFILLVSFALSHVNVTAQESEFTPPRPPPLDPGSDFDDLEGDMMEVDDEAFRPPPPPVGGIGDAPYIPGGAPPPPPIPNFRPPGAQFNDGENASDNGKLRFRVVDGEYWEKGKRRTRGRKMRHSGTSAN